MNDIALIVGTASCVWDDLNTFWMQGEPHTVFVLNDMGIHYPKEYQHWVSSHREYFGAAPLRKWRWKHDFITHGVQAGKGVTVVWDFKPAPGGDTALVAAMVAWDLGYKRITIAGCPQDDSPHYYTLPGRWRGQSTPEDNGDKYNERFIPHWREFIEKRPGVDLWAMSGNVRKMLEGKP